MNTPELRNDVADRLTELGSRTAGINAFIGLDGFVDEIFHVVDKRESAEKYQRLPTIAKFAERLSAAAGTGTNLELVSQFKKLGGNGPIMANALARFGFPTTYLGILGYPSLHPVFVEFAKQADVHSIAEPGYTDALEFEDGKIMVGKHQSLREMNWENIQARFGKEKFLKALDAAGLVGFVNWTMLTHMSEVWAAVLKEICPRLRGQRRTLFIDLADPEKRTHVDIQRATELISAFEKHFEVILGLNEKEAVEIAENIGITVTGRSPEELAAVCGEIHARVPIHSVVVHPTSYALASGPDGAQVVQGPFTLKPRITTGAGDHFNAGFCLGKMLGFGTKECLLTGVATSGYYVRTAVSPRIQDLIDFLKHWPAAAEIGASRRVS